MHVELVVPALLSAQAAPRLPAAELLLARGRRAEADPKSLEEWLRSEFELAEEEPLPAGALTLLAEGRDPGEATWARADPVHLQLMRDRILLVPGEAFRLAEDEAAALCESLNRHFEGRLRIEIVAPGRWCARLEAEVPIPETSALDMAGRSVSPRGAADALLNEVQMALHEHPVNEAREARGEPVVNSVWLWGAGRAPASASARWQSVSSGEPLSLGLARAAGVRGRPPSESAEAWLDRSPEEGRHLVVLDTLRLPLALGDPASLEERMRALDEAWFAPLLVALRAGRIGMVTVHVPDTGRSFEAIRGDLRRFWRRPRALSRSTIPA